jgi:hypothetical protein
MINYECSKRPSFLDTFLFLKPYKIYYEDKLDVLE